MPLNLALMKAHFNRVHIQTAEEKNNFYWRSRRHNAQVMRAHDPGHITVWRTNKQSHDVHERGGQVWRQQVQVLHLATSSQRALLSMAPAAEKFSQEQSRPAQGTNRVKSKKIGNRFDPKIGACRCCVECGGLSSDEPAPLPIRQNKVSIVPLLFPLAL